MEEKRVQNIIKALNQSDENTRLEVKRGQSIGRSILETICSFSNEPGLDGGTIVLGISEDKDTLFPNYRITGIDDPDKLQMDLASQCADVFNQSIRPKISVETINDKNVLLLDIEELPPQMKPVFFKKT